MWRAFEQNKGSPEDVKKVEGMIPIVTKKRHVDQEKGQMVEGLSTPLLCFLHQFFAYLFFFLSDWDLVFADDERESNPMPFKLMQMAPAWKQARNGAFGTSIVIWLYYCQGR